MNILSGPMFEPANSGPWKSVHNKQGAHYNIYGHGGERGMEALREFFGKPGSVNDMNLVLFSTSGIHGTYGTIEEAEQELQTPAEGDEESHPEVTFLILQPRLVCLRYGNCNPANQDDIDFLKRIRSESLEAMKRIGWPETPEASAPPVGALPEGSPSNPLESSPLGAP